MNSEQERIKKKIEQNPIAECNRIQNKYCPNLFSRFADVNDQRNQNYINYSTKTMLGTLYYKCIGGISSMQEMTRQFNDEKMDEIDEATYIGLCMGLQHELAIEPADENE